VGRATLGHAPLAFLSRQIATRCVVDQSPIAEPNSASLVFRVPRRRFATNASVNLEAINEKKTSYHRRCSRCRGRRHRGAIVLNLSGSGLHHRGFVAQLPYHAECARRRQSVFEQLQLLRRLTSFIYTFASSFLFLLSRDRLHDLAIWPYAFLDS